MVKFFVAGHALIEREKKYLVTRRSRKNSYMPLKWDIPGGIAKSGETLEDTIYREVNEETNLKIKIGSVVFVYSNLDQLPVRQTFQIVYLCKFISGEVRLNPLEHDKYQWLEHNNIVNLDTIDFLGKMVKFYRPKFSSDVNS